MGKCGVPPPPPPGEPPPCSHTDERCATAADCCDAKATCVGHYCAVVEPPG
jgi:hypothetical protein